MQKIYTFILVLAFVLLGSASFASAGSLNSSQISSVTSLLQSYGVSTSTISNIQSLLSASSATTSTSTSNTSSNSSSMTTSSASSSANSVTTSNVAGVPQATGPVTITVPNGGETYKAGGEISVGWVTETNNKTLLQSSNTVTIKLNYYNDNGSWVASSDLATMSLNDGRETVALPTTLPSASGASWGDKFKISVTIFDVNGAPLGFDHSNNFFSVLQ